MNTERKRILLRSVILSGITLLVLFAGLKWIELSQEKEYQEQRSSGTDEFMQSNVVVWEGERYRKTPAVTVILIAGIDKVDETSNGVSTNRYRNGGQADFLMLLAIDHTNRQIHQLQIDRDTMAEMTILSVFGVETGTRIQQICLSHSYGANKEENAHYTIRAVRNLMENMEIDGYYMINYSAVGILNNMLGGVTVTIPADMTNVNPLWEKGRTVTLTDSEAVTFVRTRKTVGEGTNAERMVRQNEFMSNAIAQMRSLISGDQGFAARFLNALKQNAATGFSDQQLIEEIQQAADYEILPVSYLEGQYMVSDQGYMEFYAEENSAERWIIENLYEKAAGS